MTEVTNSWAEWGRTTRFLESALLAFDRERTTWLALQIANKDAAYVEASAGAGKYQVALSDHIAALQDEQALFGAVLLQTYAYSEHLAAERLGVDSREFQGIEDWASRLLRSNNRTWSEVLDGMAGAVEVAVVRNAFAHGTRKIDARGHSRLVTAGMLTRSAGESVQITYDELRLYRDRLRSILRLSGFRS